jgi:hypothetical protein
MWELIVRCLQKCSLLLDQDVVRLGNTISAFRLLTSKYKKNRILFTYFLFVEGRSYLHIGSGALR